MDPGVWPQTQSLAITQWWLVSPFAYLQVYQYTIIIVDAKWSFPDLPQTFTKAHITGKVPFAHVWQMCTCGPRSSKTLHEFLHDYHIYIYIGLYWCVCVCVRVFLPKTFDKPHQKCCPVSLLWVGAPHVFSKKQPQETRSRNQATQASTSPRVQQERVAWLHTSLTQRALAKQSWDRTMMMVIVMMAMVVVVMMVIMNDNDEW